MTWAKYSTEFADDCAAADLTDRAYRTHSEGISWVYRMEDPKLRIPKNLIRRFAGSDEYELAVKELVDTGFWRERETFWEIVHHADVIRQSLAAQQQKRDRDKKAQSARRKRLAEPAEISGGVSADDGTDVSAGSAETQTIKQTSLHPRAIHQQRTA